MSVFSDFRPTIVVLACGLFACGGPEGATPAPISTDSSALASFDVDVEDARGSLYTRIDAAGTVDYALRTDGGWREGRVRAVDAAGAPQQVLGAPQARAVAEHLLDALIAGPDGARSEAQRPVAAPADDAADPFPTGAALQGPIHFRGVPGLASAEPHRDVDAEPHRPAPEAEPHKPVDPTPEPEAEPHKPTAEPH